MSSSSAHDQSELVSLIRSAMDRYGMRQSTVADSAGLQRSHLSQFLRGNKGLGKENLIAVADVLNIPRNHILDTGSHSAPADVSIDPSSFLLLPTDEARQLNVVTDPRFFDSSLFAWILYRQPFKLFGITCNIIPVDWADVPEKLDEFNAVGFYNRRSAIRLQSHKLYNVASWNDLCVYKGYALMSRPNEFEEADRYDGMDLTDYDSLHEYLQVANSYLQSIIDHYEELADNPTIISIGGDTHWKLVTPLNPNLTFGPDGPFAIHSITSPDLALDKFLDGAGDLFVGGLSQRLRAREMGCREVISFMNNPLLFSTNSLVCSESFLNQRHSYAILSAISSMWYNTIMKLRHNSNFRRSVCNDIPTFLSQISIPHESITEDSLNEVLPGSEHDGLFEDFPEKPMSLSKSLVNVITRATNLILIDSERPDEPTFDYDELVPHIHAIMSEYINET